MLACRLTRNGGAVLLTGRVTSAHLQPASSVQENQTRLVTTSSPLCAIDLLQGRTPLRGRLFSLSAPEHKAMEKYVKESLATGIVRPSSSPAGVRFLLC